MTGLRQEALARLLIEADERGIEIAPGHRERAAEEAELWDTIDGVLGDMLDDPSTEGSC